MLNINDGWSYSSGINSAGKAFIERWIELFYHLTIDNYRVKHLNVRVGFQELGQVVEDSDANLIDSSNIEYVSLEVLHLLKVDQLLRSYCRITNIIIHRFFLHLILPQKALIQG